MVCFLVFPVFSIAAQIVCVDTGTVRDGIQEIGDIVAVHDDDVQLTGRGYEHFQIIKISGTVDEALAIINGKLPELKTEKDVSYWDDGGTWREIKKEPKFKCKILFPFIDLNTNVTHGYNLPENQTIEAVR